MTLACHLLLTVALDTWVGPCPCKFVFIGNRLQHKLVLTSGYSGKEVSIARGRRVVQLGEGGELGSSDDDSSPQWTFGEPLTLELLPAAHPPSPPLGPGPGVAATGHLPMVAYPRRESTVALRDIQPPATSTLGSPWRHHSPDTRVSAEGNLGRSG